MSSTLTQVLAEGKGAHVLLQTVAQGKNQSAGASQTGYVAPCGHLCGNKPQRAMATIPTLATQMGMTNDWLKDQGVLSVKELWVHIHYPATAR